MSSRAWLFFPLCILIFSLSVDAVEEASGKIIHVGKENTYEYQSIQEAIVVSSVGDTVFVHRGIYHESVVVSKAINLIGEDKNTTIIDGVERAIFVYCRGVKVSGFTIQNCDAGIFIESDGNIVSNNILKNNSRGIWGLESDNNIISDNILENNNQSIVLSLHSDNNTVSGNILKNNDRGITLGLGSSDNKITDNLIINSSYGVYLEDLCCNNIFSNNIIKNNEVGIYFSEGCKGNKLSNNTFLNNRKNIQRFSRPPCFPLYLGILIYSACIAGIAISVIKRRYWMLSFGFLTIIFGVTISLIPFFMGGYTVENMEIGHGILFYLFGFLMLAGIVVVLVGVVLLIILFITTREKIRYKT